MIRMSLALCFGLQRHNDGKRRLCYSFSRFAVRDGQRAGLFPLVAKVV